MKFKIIFVLSIFLVLFSSCYNTADELWINSDGSGRLESNIDLSSIYPFMVMSLEKNKNNDVKNDSLEVEDKNDEAFFELFKADKIDTLFNVGKVFEAKMIKEGKSVDETWDEIYQDDMYKSLDAEGKVVFNKILALFRAMDIHITTDKKKMSMDLKTISNFDHINDYYNLGNELKTIMPYFGNDTTQNNNIEKLNQLENAFSGFASFKVEGNKLKIHRKAVDLSAMAGEGRNELSMAKMFMSNSPYKLIIHLPGKVKRMSEGVTKIDKRTVEIKISLDELISTTKEFDYEITFKGLKK